MESVIHTPLKAHSAGDKIIPRTDRNAAWGSSSKST